MRVLRYASLVEPDWGNGDFIKIPGPEKDEPRKACSSLQDAQRAIGIIRKRADDWGIDPKNRNSWLLGWRQLSNDGTNKFRKKNLFKD